MRKKYLSALLFGALVMASTATFTSCKDYDDDIDQVNTNINAVKSDLSSKMDAVNTSISGLTSAQSEIKGSLSAVNKQIETLSADGAKAVAALKAELQKADADQKAALEDQIAQLTAQLEAQLVSLNTQAAQLTAQQAQIETILAELEATKAGIEAANAKLDKAEAELKEGIAANSQDIAALNERLTTALNEIATAFENKIDTELAIVQAQISALETVQTNHQTSIESMLVVLDGISGQIAAINGQLDTINGSVGENTAAIEALKATIDTLKQEMEEKIVASHDKIREEIAAVDTKLGAEIEVVKNDLAALAGELATQKTAFDLQLAALVKYQEELAAADIDHDGRITANASDIAGNAAAIEANKVSIEENKAAAEQAIAELKAVLTEKIEGLETEYAQKIADITANHDALQAIVESLQGDVEGIHSSITDILAGITEIDGGINEIIDYIGGIEEGIEGNINRIDNEIIGMLVSIDQLQSFQAELDTRLIAVEALAASNAEGVAANAQAIQANAQAIQELVAELSAAKSALETSIADSNAALKGELGKDIQDLADRVSQLQIGANDQDWEGIKALVNDAKTELTSAINTAKTELTSAYQAADTVLEGKITTLESTLRTNFDNKLVTLTSSVNTMVTNVAFATEIPGVLTSLTDNFQLMTAIEKSAVFGGEGIENSITFTDGNQYHVGKDFYIRVSPASATITKEMISLVNTQGGSLDGIVKVTNVERYNGLLSASRAANVPNGIWKVSVKAENYNADAFKAATKDGDKTILYAVAIDSKAGSNENESRAVVSPFTLGFAHEAYKAQKALNFNVNNVAVADIQNRYDSQDLEDSNTKELKWYTTDNDRYPIPAVVVTNNNTADDTDDDRSESQGKKLLPAVQGENITIKLDGPASYSSNIRAMYVTLDKDYTTADDPSEIVAWEAYEYTNLNKVVEGKEISIKVDSKRSIRDIIGFRVYAVNYDGTMVDPDGKAFYVKIGMDGVTIPATATEVVATYPEYGNNPWSATYEFAEETFSDIRGIKNIASFEWTADGIGSEWENTPGIIHWDANGFKVRLVDKDDNPVWTSNELDVNASANGKTLIITPPNSVDLSAVVGIKTQFNHGLKYIVDNRSLKGTLVMKDADRFAIATMEVTAKKVLPATAPADFTVKVGQIVGGVHYAYLEPIQVGSDVVGQQKLTRVFNNWVDYDSRRPLANYYNAIFENAQLDSNSGEYTKSLKTGADYSIPADLVDNTTQHATSIQYIYPGVSTASPTNMNNDKAVTVKQFNTVFCSIFHENVMSWRWSTGTELGLHQDENTGKWYSDPALTPSSVVVLPKERFVYGAAVFTIGVEAIFGNNTFNATDYSKNLKALITKLNWDDATAKLISKENGMEDYFEIEVTDDAQNSNKVLKVSPKANVQNPVADVPSELQLKVKDKFGKDVIIRLDVTVYKDRMSNN